MKEKYIFSILFLMLNFLFIPNVFAESTHYPEILFKNLPPVEDIKSFSFSDTTSTIDRIEIERTCKNFTYFVIDAYMASMNNYTMESEYEDMTHDVRRYYAELFTRYGYRYSERNQNLYKKGILKKGRTFRDTNLTTFNYCKKTLEPRFP